MSNKLLGLFIALAATNILSPAIAFDPAKDRWLCQQESAICLTSFRWCSDYKDDTSKGCTFPDGYFPYVVGDDAKNPAMVFWENEYTLSWQGMDPDYSILVNWHFVRDKDTPSNSSDLYWSKELKGKETSFTFTFKDLAAEFPTKDHDDVQPDQVKAAASNPLNIWAVSQPDRPYEGRSHGMPWQDKSQKFSVMDTDVVNYLDTQRILAKEAERKKWTRAVAISVGLGVPVLMAAAFMVGRLLGGGGKEKKRSGYKNLDYRSGYNKVNFGED